MELMGPRSISPGGDAGKEVDARTIRTVEAPVGGQHTRLLETVVERVAVEELDMAHTHGHESASRLVTCGEAGSSDAAVSETRSPEAPARGETVPSRDGPS